MTIQEGFERIFQNSYFIFDSNVKDSANYGELNFLQKSVEHNFIVELINWFAKNYNTDILGMYKDYLCKCDNSIHDRIVDFINEDI